MNVQNARPNIKTKMKGAGHFCGFHRLMIYDNAHKLHLNKAVDIKSIKIYYMEGHNNPGVSPLQPDVKQKLIKCVDYLRDKCADCEPLYLKELEIGFDIWMCAMTDPKAPALERELANLNGHINPYIELCKSMFGLSKVTLPSILSCFDYLITGSSNEKYFNHLTRLRTELTKTLHNILGDNGVLIYPGHPETAPKHNQTILKVVNISYTCVFNTLDVAITSVPLGLTSDGLPVGVQIIAKPFNDRLTIALAEELERGLSGWTAPELVISYAIDSDPTLVLEAQRRNTTDTIRYLHQDLDKPWAEWRPELRALESTANLIVSNIVFQAIEDKTRLMDVLFIDTYIYIYLSI
ncbi:unnamed protein product [Medioppia subpectinata]|uniref:Amidase domain-containing protein n=1 Tax=Medioppia subpectinata TaxID=1979941 RepID=A0A7R9KR19_9ACAR|nr:unnamed protein product [Medioppia subpectinata]CAG2106869.1 unnamed protein product [Medioppia subpectinata]